MTPNPHRGGEVYLQRGDRAERVALFFYNLYTQQKTPRVKERSFPEHENPYTVGHVCFIDRLWDLTGLLRQ